MCLAFSSSIILMLHVCGYEDKSDVAVPFKSKNFLYFGCPLSELFSLYFI